MDQLINATDDAGDIEAAEQNEPVLGWVGSCDHASRCMIARSDPNSAYFHRATAYNLLRYNGVPVGKLDYLGGTAQD